MELILNLGKNRGRYLCDCGAMFETVYSYKNRYRCRNCQTVYSGYNETKYLRRITGMNIGWVLQQYSNESLLSSKGNKLSFDGGIFHTKTSKLPKILFEVLSYQNLCNSNQDGARDNYIKKVKFARNELKIPLLEFIENDGENVETKILKAISNYNNISGINDSSLYADKLNKTFYEPIIERIGSHYF